MTTATNTESTSWGAAKRNLETFIKNEPTIATFLAEHFPLRRGITPSAEAQQQQILLVRHLLTNRHLPAIPDLQACLTTPLDHKTWQKLQQKALRNPRLQKAGETIATLEDAMIEARTARGENNPPAERVRSPQHNAPKPQDTTISGLLMAEIGEKQAPNGYAATGQRPPARTISFSEALKNTQNRDPWHHAR